MKHVSRTVHIKISGPTDRSVPINQLINQTSVAPISPAKPGSLGRQPNQCSTAKSIKQFRNINRPWGGGVTVTMVPLTMVPLTLVPLTSATPSCK